GRVVEVTVRQNERGRGIPGGAAAGTWVQHASLDDPVIDGAGQDPFGVGQGALADQNSVAGPIGDIGHAGSAIAVENPQAARAERVRFISSDAGGVAGRRGQTERVAKTIWNREGGRWWHIRRALVNRQHCLDCRRLLNRLVKGKLTMDRTLLEVRQDECSPPPARRRVGGPIHEWAGGLVTRREYFLSVVVAVQGQPDLLEVVQALRACSGRTHFLNGGNQQG